MEYILSSDGLEKKYKNFTALSNFSIHVPKGSIYGLVGKNGAGKTTLIRLICGMQNPTGGAFSLYGAGNNTKGIYKAREQIGAIIENPAIFRDMTAKENLIQQFRVLGIKNIKKADGILELVGLSDTGKKKAGNFSLGMRQRLAIAIALCSDPDFLILDEPMNGLDPQGIIEIRELIQQLNKKGVTILISSHILDELAKVATHYGFVNGGKMVREMSVEELEASKKKSTVISVDSIEKFKKAVEKTDYDFRITSDSSIEISGEVNITALVAKLYGEGCIVNTLKEKEDDLESFFIDLVGGEGK